MIHFLFGLVLSLISLFLILLVLVQRGRGGGLTGALGGMGGQSAFGTKAGDAFTRVTVISATIWILAAILAVKLLGGREGPLGDADAAVPAAATAPAANEGTSLDDLLPARDDEPADAADGGTSTRPGIGAPVEIPPSPEADPE